MTPSRNAGRRFSSWPQCRTGHGGDDTTTMLSKSTVPRDPSRRAWVLGLRIEEPSKRSNSNNNNHRGRGRLSERGTDDQLDTAETQPCSCTLVPCVALAATYDLPACIPACISHTVEGDASWRSGRRPSRPSSGPTDLVSSSSGAALHRRAAAWLGCLCRLARLNRIAATSHVKASMPGPDWLTDLRNTLRRPAGLWLQAARAQRRRVQLAPF